MPSSMCWPAGCSSQRSIRSAFQRRCSVGAKTPVLLMNPARLVEVATSGAVVTRYGATCSLRARSTRTRPKTSWVEIGLFARTPVASGTAIGRDCSRGGRASASRREATQMPAGVAGSSRSHSVSRGQPARGTQRVDLLGGQQRGVVARVAGDRQPPALHGVGEDHARPVGDGVALGVRVEHRGEVVAAEVGDEGGEFVVGDVGDERLDGGGGAVEELPCAVPRRPARTATGTARWAWRRSSRAAPRRPAGCTPRRAGGRT